MPGRPQVRRLVVMAGAVLLSPLVAGLPAHAAAVTGKPTISKVSPSAGSFKGGTRVTITGTNLRSVKSVTFNRVSATHRTVAASGRWLTVTAPSNDVGWATIRVTTASGQTTRSEGFLYQAPTTIDPPRDAPIKLSCPAGHCYGLDQYDNFVDAGSGSGYWSYYGPPEPAAIAESLKTACASNHNCSGVSCPRPGYCVTVDDQSHPWVWSKGVWKQYPAVAPRGSEPNLFYYPRFVSCGSAYFCMVSDEFGDYSIWNGTTWSALRTLAGKVITTSSDHHAGPVLETLSCAGTACLALDRDANTYKFGAGRWSDEGLLLSYVGDYGLDFNQVSCANVSSNPAATRLLCVADVVDFYGTYLVRFAGGQWLRSDVEQLPSSAMASVSCNAGGKCIAIKQDGSTYEYGDSTAVNDAHGWTGPVAMPGVGAGKVLAISCQAATTCVATISPSFATTFQLAGRTWTTPRRIVVPREGLTAVGCALDGGHDRYCLAGDAGPFVVDYVAGAWRKPVRKFRVTDHAVSASCVAGHRFCLAISNAGQSLIDSNGTQTLTSMPSDNYVAVSCWSVTGCYAVSATNLYQWNGSSWSGPTELAGRGIGAVTDIACVAADSSCLAVTEDGQSFRVDGTTTTEPISMGAGATVSAVSCQSTTRCLAIADHFYSYTEGSGWTDEGDGGSIGTGFFPGDGVSCAPSTTTTHCVAVGPFESALSWNGTALHYVGNGNRYYTPEETSVACLSTTACVAGNIVGEMRSYP